MHPVLARYIDQELTREVLRRAEAKEPVEEAHRHLVEAAAAHPAERKAVLRATGRHLDAQGQQAALFIATHAALRAIREEPRFIAPMAEAEAALKKGGAQSADIDAVLAQVVADEAFGTDEDPGSFDAAWFLESLSTLPGLLALDEEAVDDLLSEFTQKAPAAQRPLRDRVATSLLESAWSQGPSLISTEDLEDAIDAVAEGLSGQDFPAAAQALGEFVEFLGARGLMGPLRTERLVRTARNAALGGGLAAEEEEETGEEEEDDPV